MSRLTDADRGRVANAISEATAAKLRQKRAQDDSLINGDGDLHVNP